MGNEGRFSKVRRLSGAMMKLSVRSSSSGSLSEADASTPASPRTPEKQAAPNRHDSGKKLGAPLSQKRGRKKSSAQEAPSTPRGPKTPELLQRISTYEAACVEKAALSPGRAPTASPLVQRISSYEAALAADKAEASPAKTDRAPTASPLVQRISSYEAALAADKGEASPAKTPVALPTETYAETPAKTAKTAASTPAKTASIQGVGWEDTLGEKVRQTPLAAASPLFQRISSFEAIAADKGGASPAKTERARRPSLVAERKAAFEKTASAHQNEAAESRAASQWLKAKAVVRLARQLSFERKNRKKMISVSKKDDLEKVRAGLVTPDVPQVPAQTEVA